MQGKYNVIAAIFRWLNSISPIVLGFGVGFLWQILVIFGLHWALVPVALLNMTKGGDIILSSMFGTTFAQTGAAISAVAGIGVFGYTAFINPMTSNTGKVIYSIIISVACLVAAFVLEMIFFRESAQPESEAIFSPMNGHGQS